MPRNSYKIRCWQKRKEIFFVLFPFLNLIIFSIAGFKLTKHNGVDGNRPDTPSLQLLLGLKWTFEKHLLGIFPPPCDCLKQACQTGGPHAAPSLVPCGPQLSYQTSKLLKLSNFQTDFDIKGLKSSKIWRTLQNCDPLKVLLSLNMTVQTAHGFDMAGLKKLLSSHCANR